MVWRHAVKARVVLLQAPIGEELNELVAMHVISSPPLGILYIATVLEQHGVDVHVRDLTTHPMPMEEFGRWLCEVRPTAVGMSVSAVSCEGAMELADVVRVAVPEAKIVFGGPLATFIPEELLRRGKVDYVVMGEGEITMLELCEALSGQGARKSVADVPGLALRNGRDIIRTAPRGLVNNLDSLPIPKREFLSLDEYDVPYSIITSRGCLGKCTFCSAKAFWGGGVRYRSMSNVEKELIYLKDRYSPEHLFISDDTFTTSTSRMTEFCDILARNDFNVRWYCNGRVDRCGKAMLARMFGAGCRKLLLGVESADNDVLQSIGKQFTIEQAENAIRAARGAGLDVTCSFIIGHPLDTTETVRKTLDFALRVKQTYGCHSIVLFNTPYPGTPQFNSAKEMGMHLSFKSWDDYTTRWILEETRYLDKRVIAEFKEGKLDGQVLDRAYYEMIVPEESI
jgi:radical SAM superfamily enzyme YgiQ (UPF0313 family)